MRIYKFDFFCYFFFLFFIIFVYSFVIFLLWCGNEIKCDVLPLSCFGQINRLTVVNRLTICEPFPNNKLEFWDEATKVRSGLLDIFFVLRSGSVEKIVRKFDNEEGRKGEHKEEEEKKKKKKECREERWEVERKKERKKN